MRHRKRSFFLFVLCVTAVFGAMTWLTAQLLRYEQQEQNLRQAEYTGAQRRTALWRIESTLGIFLTQEAARPYFHYFTFYEPDQAYTKLLTVACAGDVSVPSPLLSGEPDFCRLHFQLKQGSLLTPMAPTDAAQRVEALRRAISSADVEQATSELHRLEVLLPVNQLPAMADQAAYDRRQLDAPPQPLSTRAQNESEQSDLPVQTYTPGGVRQKAQTEYWARQQTANMALRSSQTVGPLQTESDPGGDIEQGMMAPYWIATGGAEPELFLLRTVRIKNEEIVQGVWVDWPRLRTTLLTSIRDLLPTAELRPEATPSPNPERSIAGIRAALVTPEAPKVAVVGLTPLRKSLVIAWCAVLAALVAIGIVLHASMELGERRGQFVSAVTHELRTPLTTFCLYSEMLADGLVRDEAKKHEYVVTLKREAQRLAKIVENVLCYARLSEVRATTRVEDIDASDLLTRVIPSLDRRAHESGMDLVVDADAAHGVMLHVDPQTIERILSNLVENACRYAGGYAPAGEEPDSRLHLKVGVSDQELRVIVADHGPGVSPELRAKLFRAFNRVGRETNNAAPGLGLGLSLSRGLARSMGGDLVLLNECDFARGAAFELRVPAEVCVSPSVVAAHAT